MLSNQSLNYMFKVSIKTSLKSLGYGVYTPESTLQDTLIHYAKA